MQVPLFGIVSVDERSDNGETQCCLEEIPLFTKLTCSSGIVKFDFRDFSKITFVTHIQT
jgi:hypothetical protein